MTFLRIFAPKQLSMPACRVPAPMAADYIAEQRNRAVAELAASLRRGWAG